MTKISDMPTDSSLTGFESVPIYDPNELLAINRNKRILLSRIMGQTGAAGANGKSAYELWLLDGNTGSVNDFLTSLIGPTGQSSYSLWVSQGHVGNESEFLASLVGPTGPSLYQVWLDAGHTGTEQDFLDTVTGPAGASGSIIFNGTSAPNDANGVNGDYYINTTDGGLFSKAAGTWGSSILTIKGTIWLTGSGVPSGATGGIGNFYLNTTNGAVYGPKTTGGWGGIVANIRGPQGIQGIQGLKGATILSGTGVPNNANGANGDYYLDTGSGNFYGPKTSGAWSGTPTLQLIAGGSNIGFRDGTNTLIFNRTFDEGLSFDQAGDVTLDFDDTNRKLIISSTTSWSTLQSKPTTRNGFGLTDVYTSAETDSAISTAAATALSSANSYTDTKFNSLTNPLEYEGTYNATTNTPALSDSDTNKGGWVYQVTTAGTQDFGHGNITFKVNDKVVNNGTVWEKWDMTDAVSSVNGDTGDVVLDTDNVAEGIANLYFTDPRAVSAVAAVLDQTAEITLSYTGGFIVGDLRDGSIANIRLANSSVTIAGTAVNLGSSISRDNILGLSTNGLVQRTGANTYAIATAGTDYASPTNGTTGQVLTSDGAGGFGTPHALSDFVLTTDIGTTVCPLVGGFVPSGNLPSYVDDVIEVANYAALPGTGETGKIYVVLSGGAQPDNKQYRWTGSTYVEIVSSPGTTDNVPEGTTNLYFTDTRARTAVGTTSGIIKGNGAGTISAATAGTDYAAATNGTSGQVLTSDGAGGFGTAISPATLTKTFIPVTCSDETTALTTGIKATFRMVYGFTLTGVRASLTTAQASGSIFTVDVKVNSVSILSTLITIDNTESSSFTAATQPVLSSTTLTDNDEVSIEITQIGDGTATGLKAYLLGNPT